MESPTSNDSTSENTPLSPFWPGSVSAAHLRSSHASALNQDTYGLRGGVSRLRQELELASEREASLAQQLGRSRAEAAELSARLTTAQESYKTAKRSAREALTQMAEENAKLVAAFVEKRQQVKRLQVSAREDRALWQRRQHSMELEVAANKAEIQKLTQQLACATIVQQQSASVGTKPEQSHAQLSKATGASTSPESEPAAQQKHVSASPCQLQPATPTVTPVPSADAETVMHDGPCLMSIDSKHTGLRLGVLCDSTNSNRGRHAINEDTPCSKLAPRCVLIEQHTPLQPDQSTSTNSCVSPKQHLGPDSTECVPRADDSKLVHELQQTCTALRQENQQLQQRNAELQQENVCLKKAQAEAQALRKRVENMQDAEHHKQLGNRSYQAKQYKQAYKHYTEALQVKVEDATFNAVLYCNRAAALHSLGQYIDAIADCCIAAHLDATYPRVLQRRADAFCAIGDYSSAVADLQKLCQLDSGREAQQRLREVQQRVQQQQHSSSTSINHYMVLGVSSSNAATDSVKAAYRRLALKYHPDKAANSAHKAAADVVFKLITAANAVLSDSGKRTAYDTSRKRAQLYQMASSGFSMHNSCSRAHSGRF
eukprot:jgi/Chrzof1/3365/Cz12g22140.t1